MLCIKAIYQDVYWEPIAGNLLPSWIETWLSEIDPNIKVSYIDYGPRYIDFIGPLLPRAEIDHILAISLGGDSMDIENLQTLCHNCHAKKTGYDRRKLHALINKKNVSKSDRKQLFLDSYFW